jgi:hypothetical protein
MPPSRDATGSAIAANGHEIVGGSFLSRIGLGMTPYSIVVEIPFRGRSPTHLIARPNDLAGQLQCPS